MKGKDKEEILNKIAAKVSAINELREIKRKVKDTPGDRIKFKVETEAWCGFLDIGLVKEKSNLNISKYAMTLILNEAIGKEKRNIDNLLNTLSKLKEGSENESNA